MAKKVRRKPEDEGPTFQFPEFDEAAFVAKESELAGGLIFGIVVTVLLGAVSWGITRAGQAWWMAFGIGVLGIALSPFLIARLRPRSDLYTKGDWAGIILFEFFGWLALWFALVNVV